MRRLLVLGTLVALAGLAGCLGDDSASPELDEQATNDSSQPTLEEPNVTFETGSSYTFDAEDQHEVRWENNSFSPASCFVCPDGEHRYDVTDMLARGAPTRLQAELDASTNLVDATAVWIETEGEATYQVNSSDEQARAVLGPETTTAEVVVYNFFPDANPEVSYELRIEANANRSQLPAYAPAEVPLPEDPPGLVVDGTQTGDEARLMLWDGTDDFLGHHALEDETTINVSGAEGPLVAYLAGGAGSVKLAPVNASATDTALRALTLASQEATKTASTNSQVQIEAPVERVPLQAGLFIQGSYQAGTSYSGELAAGNETLLSFESGGYLTGADSRFTRWSQPGAPELGPVAYVGTFEFSASTGGEAGVIWVTYQR